MIEPADLVDEDQNAAIGGISHLERRGRWWLALSFLACPCHLPLTLVLLATALGGTAVGTLLRDHGWVAGAIIAAAWLVGTGRGLLLVRRGQREGFACPVRTG